MISLFGMKHLHPVGTRPMTNDQRPPTSDQWPSDYRSSACGRMLNVRELYGGEVRLSRAGRLHIDLDERRAARYQVAGPEMDPRNNAVVGRDDRMFHFHRFQHD